MELNNDEIRRYARHVILPEVGLAGQKKIRSTSVLCVGAGGLGSPILLYLAAAGIGRLGIVRQRVRALQALATAVASGAIELHRGAPLAATLDALRALPGIGDWTAQVIAMRALAWPDAWPASDIGLMNALGSRDAKVITAQAEAWRPWRAYAVMQLWQHLETST